MIDHETLRQRTMAAVIAMDELALNRVAVMAGLSGWADEFTDTISRAVLTATHEVQQFWTGECGCHQETPQERIAIGRPVTFQPELIAMHEAAGPDVEIPPIYPGSRILPCSKCQTPTYQGPRVQEAAETNPGLIFMCYLCAITTIAGQAADDSAEVTITSMGNPYERKRS